MIQTDRTFIIKIQNVGKKEKYEFQLQYSKIQKSKGFQLYLRMNTQKNPNWAKSPEINIILFNFQDDSKHSL